MCLGGGDAVKDDALEIRCSCGRWAAYSQADFDSQRVIRCTKCGEGHSLREAAGHRVQEGVGRLPA